MRDGDPISPLVARHPMPDRWRCVLALPIGAEGLSGDAEERFFGELQADPVAIEPRVSRVLADRPAARSARGDIDEFGAALSEIQREIGSIFAARQGGVFHPRAAPLVDALLALGVGAVGQSSWGPTVYGIVESAERAVDAAEGLRASAGRRCRRPRGRLRPPGRVGGARRRGAGRGVRLLVSVVSAAEARRALAGGADIIDVKDPSEGALGAPAPRVLSEVVDAVGGAAPVSVALGDLPDLPHTAALAARGAVLSGAAFVKVGLRGVVDLDRAVAVMRAVADAVGDRADVIAAAYADAGALDPPALAPALLPDVVRLTGIAGALVDTFVKDGRGLYGWLSEGDVAGLVARTRAAGGSSASRGSCAPASCAASRRTSSGCARRSAAAATARPRLTPSWSRPPSQSSEDWRCKYACVSWIAKLRRLAGGNAGPEAIRGSDDHGDAGPARQPRAGRGPRPAQLERAPARPR